MGQVCSRGSDGAVIPVTAEASLAEPSVSSAAVSDLGKDVDGKGEEVSEKTAVTPLSSALTDVDPSEAFTVSLLQGDGHSFSMRCHAGQTVDNFHIQISQLLGAKTCPIYSIRLVFKGKAISMDNYLGSTLVSFGVEEGSTLNLIVVRSAPPPVHPRGPPCPAARDPTLTCPRRHPAGARRCRAAISRRPRRIEAGGELSGGRQKGNKATEQRQRGHEPHGIGRDCSARGRGRGRGRGRTGGKLRPQRCGRWLGLL